MNEWLLPFLVWSKIIMEALKVIGIATAITIGILICLRIRKQ